MNIHFKNGNDFELFKDDLRSRLEQREYRKIEDTDYKKSAVAILLMNKNSEPHVLLTLRSEKVSTHKGDMSLPGGRHDDTDADLMETAYRETFEEVGISRDKIDHLGRFDDYISMFGHHITCYVGAIDYPSKYVFSEDEIDDYLEAPLSIFLDLRYDRIQEFQWGDKPYKVYYYYYNKFKIWGLTARFLTDFTRKVIRDKSE